MNFGTVVINILTILCLLAALAVPFGVQFLIFKWDKKKKISHLRWRTMVGTAIFMLVTTVFFLCTDGAIGWTAKKWLSLWGTEEFAKTVQDLYTERVYFVFLVNLALEGIFVLYTLVLRQGLPQKDILKPDGADGTFSLPQKIERWVLKKLNHELWFLIGKIIFYAGIAFSGFYALWFVTSFAFVLFPSEGLSYETLHIIFESGYLYPVITLLTLWESYYFLEGVKRINRECPGFLGDGKSAEVKPQINLEAIDAEVKKLFGSHYKCDIGVASTLLGASSGEHSSFARLIGKAASEDPRNPLEENELYLNCMDKLAVEEKSIIINGSFFSPFSRYFFRYLSVIVARGDNVVLVCNTDEQVEAVYRYLSDGMAQIASPYCKNFEKNGVDFDDPIWKIVKISDEETGSGDIFAAEKNILVTTLNYLNSKHFEEEHSSFIPTISSVVLVDVLSTLNLYSRQLAMFNTRLEHITKTQAMAVSNGGFDRRNTPRAVSGQIRYICFDNTRMNGLDNLLKNMLTVNFEVVDAMAFSAETMVRCYTFEPSSEESAESQQFFHSCKDVSAAVNLAVFCLSQGIGKVTIFAEGIPVKNMEEMLSANAGQVSVKANINSIEFNKVTYQTTDKSVVIVLDSGCNLPATIRKYALLTSQTPTLMMFFSKAYLMRDYYYANIDRIWQNCQPEKVPVVPVSKASIAQKILIKANEGGIYADELICYAAMVPQFDEAVKSEDINSILKEILELYGITVNSETDLFKYFEFASSCEFDSAGNFKNADKIFLRRKGTMFEKINGKDTAILVTSGGETDLPVPKTRISQNYIAGQNLLHNGKLYYIKSIDFAAGKIYGQLTVASENREVYQYLQIRKYRMEINPEQVEAIFPTKHIVIQSGCDEVFVDEVFVSVFRAPMDVVTTKYYDIDPSTMSLDFSKTDCHNISAEGNDSLAKESYRRYGMMNQPGYSSDDIRRTSNVAFGERGALTMSLCIRGKFGPDPKKTQNLAVVMLNEIIHSMFPFVADSVVVAANTAGDTVDETTAHIMEKQPNLTLIGENDAFTNQESLTFMIVEDCSSELGVISVLMSAGENVLKLLFSEVFNYLEWYLKAENKSDYLQFGLKECPSCFDLEALHTLAGILGGDTKLLVKPEEVQPVPELINCTFCSARGVKGKDITVLEDGRKLCEHCAQTLVPNDGELLKQKLADVRGFLESIYGIRTEDEAVFCFDSPAQIQKMLRKGEELDCCEADIPAECYTDEKGIIHVEHSIPAANLAELLVRETVFLWQKKQLTGLAEQLAKGHAAFVVVQYLRFLHHLRLADTREAFFESTESISGAGYRQISQELINHPAFENNPFSYLISLAGKTPPKPPSPPEKPANPEKPVPQKKPVPTEKPNPSDKSVTPGNPVPPNKPVVTGQPGSAKASVPPKKDRETEEKNDTPAPKPSVRNSDNQVLCYYYTHIPERKQILYDILLGGIRQHTKTVMAKGYSFEEVCEVYYYVIWDHPELFWIDSLQMMGSEVIFVYSADVEQTKRISRRIDEVVARYLSEINDGMSAYDIALHFYIKLINNLDYDLVSLQNEPDSGIDYIRSICGPFLTGEAVCSGYAYAFQYLMQKCGIECTKISGDAYGKDGIKEKHAWNLIKIDGEYYYIDVTWDDSSNTLQKVKNTAVRLSYFCVTSEEILRTRKIKQMPHMPPVCTATKANYYYHNHLVLESYDKQRLLLFAHNAANSDMITFKCSTKAVYQQVTQKLFGEEQFCFTMLKEAHKQNPAIKIGECIHSQDDNMLTVVIALSDNNTFPEK